MLFRFRFYKSRTRNQIIIILEINMKKFFGIILILSIFLVASCKTLVYSPSVNLPDKIDKGETKIFAAYEALPDNQNTPIFNNNGVIFGIQHSFTNNYCLSLKYWSDINSLGGNKYYLHGASLTNYFLLNDKNSDFKYYIIPTIGMAMRDNEVQLGVIGSWIGIQSPIISIFKPYLTAGFMYGNYDYYNNGYGFGIPVNIGTTVNVYSNINLFFELSVGSMFDSKFYWQETAATPTIGFSLGL